MMITYCHRIIFILLGLVYPMIDAYGLSSQEILAKKTVTEYYERLENYAKDPGNFELNQQVKVLFTPEGNVVFNDLHTLEDGLRNQNEESDIDEYMSSIMNIRFRSDVSLSFTGKIDESSFIEENDPDYTVSSRKVVWVTATKTIAIPQKGNHDVKETFKIKNGYIQTISTPEQSTAIIDALRAYNMGNYEKAYYGFMQQINNSTADDDTYFYLGLMFKKDNSFCKKLYPSKDLRNKLCAFYWMKSRRGRHALFYFGVHQYYMLDYDMLKQPFACGLMCVYKGNGEQYGFMDEKGKMVIPYKFKKAYSFSEKNKVAFVQSDNGLWGVIKVNGTYAIEPKFYSIGQFSEDLFVAQSSDKWGILGFDGIWMCPPKYDQIDPLHENLAAYKENGKWGFIDSNGQVVIPAQYRHVQYFRCGLAAVTKEGKLIGFINSKNEMVVPNIYDNATSFGIKTRVAGVCKDKKWAIIDNDGELLSSFIYDKLNFDEDAKENIIVTIGKDKYAISVNALRAKKYSKYVKYYKDKTIKH